MRRAQVLMGLLLIIIGFANLLERLGGSESFFAVLGMWWPLGIVAFGLWRLASLAERPWALAGSLLVTVGGLALLSYSTGYSRYLHPYVWPLVLISAGLWIVLLTSAAQTTVVSGHPIRRLIAFANDRIDVRDTFSSARLTIFFGSLRVDLRDALIKRGARLDLNVFFGQAEVILISELHVQLVRGFIIRRGTVLSESQRPSSGGHLQISEISIFGKVSLVSEERP